MVADSVCLRCGAKINDQQVFCDDCLGYISGRAVNSNATVVLPHRVATPAPRKRIRRRVRKPEEQIHALKNWIAGLIVAIALLSVAFILSLLLNFQLLGVETFDFLPLADLSSITDWLPEGNAG